MAARPLIIHHADCMDGLCSAWVLTRFAQGLADADLHAAVHDSQPPVVDDRAVIVVDFAYSRAQMLEMHDRAESLLVLDHHKTAQAALDGLPFCTFDLGRSGAGLAWEYAQPGTEPPWVVRYVQDRDLWKFELPDSRAINAAMAERVLTVSSFDGINTCRPQDLVRKGKAILRHQAAEVRRLCSQAIEVEFFGHHVPVVHSARHASEVGNELAPGRPFAVVYHRMAHGQWRLQMRSAPGGVDVSEIATRLGGGGHQHAAGANVEDLPWSS